MPPSAKPVQLPASVEAPLRELEDLCGRIERALMHRDWSDLNGAIADSRRITHALQNAMDDSGAIGDGDLAEQIGRRVHYVQAIRDNQLTRLQYYHNAVGDRLKLLARWKTALKSLASRTRARGLAALDQLT